MNLKRETLELWKKEGVESPKYRAAIFTNEWEELCDLAIKGLSAPEEVSLRILDDREVKEIAKKSGLAKYVWDTEEGRMDLARFAHEATKRSGEPQERP